MTTGKLIQEFRVKGGYTQKTLSKALHVTDKAISKWERDICLPDTTLLPKLALLLDVDMDLLVSRSLEQEEWSGLIDIYDTDFSQTVYDKPMVYYLLSHFLLLGITTIYVLTNQANQDFLKETRFDTFGFDIRFGQPGRGNVMILDHPWFLFGSNLTQQFQGAMITRRTVKLVPENQEPVFVFTADDSQYFEDKKRFIRTASKRTLGRGMICLDMDNYDKVLDVAALVRTYQVNSGLLIGSLEEIAYRRGLISGECLMTLANSTPYGSLLKQVAGKPQVG